jgi:hypothetical protein
MEQIPIRVLDFPVGLQDAIRRAVEEFSIPLLLDNRLVGTGTLVTVDSTHGILTAAHVLRSKEGINWDNSAKSSQRLCTVLGKSSYREPMQHLDWWLTDADESEWGPDLGFVRLPTTGPFVGALRSVKSFKDITRGALTYDSVPQGTDATVAFYGVVGELTVDSDEATSLSAYAFFGCTPVRREHCGYDYLDLKTSRTITPEIPRSFGGVSGASLWRFRLIRDDGRIYPYDVKNMVLYGVAFYQIDQESKNPVVRCHGPRSIFQNALPKIREWLRS